MNAVNDFTNKLVASENAYINVAIFSLPVVNIVIRKMKEDKFLSEIKESSTIFEMKAILEGEPRRRINNLFLAGTTIQVVVAITCAAVAVATLFPTISTASLLCLAGFALFGINSYVSMIYHLSYKNCSRIKVSEKS